MPTNVLDRPCWPLHAGAFGDHRPGHPTRQRDEHLTGHRTLFVRQPTHHGRNEFRTHGRISRGINTFGHSRDGGGHDHVARYAVSGAFQRHDVGESDHAGLGGRVVGHIVVAVQAAYRRRQHDASVPRIAHHGEHGPHDMECAAQVDIQHRVEVLVTHFFQRCAAHDPGVVDEDVDAAVRIERRGDDRLAAGWGGDRVGADDSLTTGSNDLTHHIFRRTGVDAVTGEAAPWIVDDNLRPLRGEQHGVGAAEPSATSGDDRYLAIESQVSHLCSQAPDRLGRLLHAIP